MESTIQIKHVKRENNNLFIKIFLSAVGVFLLAIIITLIVLWNYLSDYEKSRPSKVMDSLVVELNTKNYNAMVNNLNLVKSGFVKSEDVNAEISKIIGSEKVTYDKAFSSDRIAHPTFKLMVGKNALATVTLKETDKKSRFKQTLYEIEHVSGLYSENKALSVSVPKNYKVIVNGKTLGAEWISKEVAASFDTAFAINEASKSLLFQVYTIDGFLSDADISVLKPDETQVKTEKDKSGKLFVNLEAAEILAPKGYKVLVNDVEISTQSWVVKENIVPESLKRIPDKYFTAERPSFTKYKVTGLVGTPKITVTDSAGKDASVTKDEKTGEYSAQLVSVDNAELEKIALDFAKMYAKTTAADFPKSTFLSKILADAPLKAELRSALRPEFYTSHKKYGFENEKTFNLKVYNENLFSCDVTLTHWISGISSSPASRVDKFTSSMRFCIMKQDGKWYIAEWGLLSE